MNNKTVKGSNGTIANAVRDVLLASINKGQFPIALIAMVAIVILLKMPGEDVSKLAFAILRDFENGRIVGWTIGVISSISWFLHSKHQRKVMHDEITRMANVRTQAQEQLHGKALPSSKKN